MNCYSVKLLVDAGTAKQIHEYEVIAISSAAATELARREHAEKGMGARVISVTVSEPDRPSVRFVQTFNPSAEDLRTIAAQPGSYTIEDPGNS